MAVNTKLRLSNAKFEQLSGTTLTLSGDTVVGTSGSICYATHPSSFDNTELVDKKYVDDNIVSGVTSGATYDGGSPATVEVGGLPVDTTLTGLTSNQILECILYPTIVGVITDPFMIGVTFDPAETYLQTGSVSSFAVCADFSRGCIDPQYCSVSDCRSGAPNSYCFTGTGTDASYGCTADFACRPITSYTVQAGAVNTWGSCTSYDCGEPALDNKGVEYCAKLIAGTVTPASATFTGIYPYFWGFTDEAPVLNSALLASASTTCVVVPSDGTICINFGSLTGKYLWFGTPGTADTKQGWYESNQNNGNIGTEPSDVWNAPTTPSVASPDAYWSGQTYKMYAMNLPTSTFGGTYCMTVATQQ